MDTTPENMLKEGRLDEALKALTAQVRSKPADAASRVFLFQLLALLGQWERARNQLKVAGELDAANTMMVGAYARALQGEVRRAEVMAGQASPSVIGEPSRWLAMLMQALKLVGEERYEQAAPLRDDAFDEAEAVSGQINDEPFAWVADADPRFGPCLEVVLQGGYSWVPFARLAALKFEEPTDLRDKIWAPVEITWSNGGQAVGFVPCRYPGAEHSEDPEIVATRKTDWRDVGHGYFLGDGQRMLATDAGEYPLLDIRTIRFDHD